MLFRSHRKAAAGAPIICVCVLVLHHVVGKIGNPLILPSPPVRLSREMRFKMKLAMERRRRVATWRNPLLSEGGLDGLLSVLFGLERSSSAMDWIAFSSSLADMRQNRDGEERIPVGVECKGVVS